MIGCRLRAREGLEGKSGHTFTYAGSRLMASVESMIALPYSSSLMWAKALFEYTTAVGCKSIDLVNQSIAP